MYSSVAAQNSFASDSCSLPECLEASASSPNALSVEETPQFIIVTFDDAINSFTESFVNKALSGLKNKNGDIVKRTYFVNELNTQVDIIRNLYLEGHEIANHTSTHQTDLETSVEEWRNEIKTLNRFLVNQVGIPSDQIAGFRAPYLKTGENMFEVLKEMNFLYDSSIPELVLNPPLVSSALDSYVWPHTFDNGTQLACLANDCPDDPIPGLWEIPMLNWVGEDNFKYDVMDPAVISSEQFSDLLEFTFDKRYNGNRVPVGIYLHAGQMWDEERQNVLRSFIEDKLALPGVWTITMRGLIEWMRNPVPVDELPDWFAAGCDRGLCRTEFPALSPNVDLLLPENNQVSEFPEIELSWEVILGASNYFLQISDSPDFTNIIVEEDTLVKCLYSFINETNSGDFYWRVKAVNQGDSSEWSEIRSFNLLSFTDVNYNNLYSDNFYKLEQNYPNPFNPSSNITYSLAENSDVKISIYNLLGEEVEILVDDYKNKGQHTISWDGSRFSSGVYFYKMNSGDFVDIKKMILLN
ncbi:MAG: polysaccharide deacetylase family protein [Melioribacteraceae bacterium]|nr:polysaccharide deacetylase family protein [Melioribacteraceae bacterium]